MKVAAVIRKKGQDVVTVLPDKSIAETADIMRHKRIGSLVVCDAKGQLVGVIAERDIVHGLAGQGANLLKLQVRDLMSSKVVTCDPEESCWDAMATMQKNHVRHLPVMEGDELVGLISVGDVAKARVDDMRLEARVLRDQILAAH